MGLRGRLWDRYHRGVKTCKLSGYVTHCEVLRQAIRSLGRLRIVHMSEQVVVAGAGVALWNGQPQDDEAVVSQINDAVHESLYAIEAVLIPAERRLRSLRRGHLRKSESQPGGCARARLLGSHLTLQRRLPVDGRARRVPLRRGRHEQLNERMRRHRDGYQVLACVHRRRRSALGARSGQDHCDQPRLVAEPGHGRVSRAQRQVQNCLQQQGCCRGERASGKPAPTGHRFWRPGLEIGLSAAKIQRGLRYWRRHVDSGSEDPQALVFGRPGWKRVPQNAARIFRATADGEFDGTGRTDERSGGSIAMRKRSLIPVAALMALCISCAAMAQTAASTPSTAGSPVVVTAPAWQTGTYWAGVDRQLLVDFAN